MNAHIIVGARVYNRTAGGYGHVVFASYDRIVVAWDCGIRMEYPGSTRTLRLVGEGS